MKGGYFSGLHSCKRDVFCFHMSAFRTNDRRWSCWSAQTSSIATRLVMFFSLPWLLAFTQKCQHDTQSQCGISRLYAACDHNTVCQDPMLSCSLNLKVFCHRLHLWSEVWMCATKENNVIKPHTSDRLQRQWRDCSQQITVWYEASCLQQTCDCYLVEMREELHCVCFSFSCVCACVCDSTVCESLQRVAYLANLPHNSWSNLQSHWRNFILPWRKL